MVNQHINNHDEGTDITPVSYNDNKLITCVSQHQALFDTRYANDKNNNPIQQGNRVADQLGELCSCGSVFSDEVIASVEVP